MKLYGNVGRIAVAASLAHLRTSGRIAWWHDGHDRPIPQQALYRRALINHCLPVLVTQEDIDEGVRMSCEHCPLARAMKRHLGFGPNSLVDGRSPVQVWDYNIEVTLPGHPPLTLVPSAEGCAFIDAFDEETDEPDALKPFRFRPMTFESYEKWTQTIDQFMSE